MASPDILPVILSGGGGTRLWPLSSAERPKQFLSLDGDASLLRQTVERVGGPGFARPLLVASERHADLIDEQLSFLGPDGADLLLEPEARNTAAAIALAALKAGDGATPLLVTPSDHVVRDRDSFLAAVSAAAPFAAEGWLCTFGIAPDRPETGYGWIRLGETLGEGVRAVAAFVEKPPLSEAERMLTDRSYVWNSGIFLFRADAALAALARHAPDIVEAARAAMAGARSSGNRTVPESEAFARAPALSFDHAVMEKADRVAVVPVEMDWSDVGSWDALYDLSESDAEGNVCLGDALAIEAGNCLLQGDGSRRVAVLGVSDLIVVASGDRVLVLPRGRSQEVKKILAALEARSR